MPSSKQPARLKINLGSKGPFVGPFDLALKKCSLPLEHFDTHMYVVGKTKKGKSCFLDHVLFQLIYLDQGVGVLDPHADLANDLLAYLASYPRAEPWLSRPENFERLIYLDPSRKDYLIPFNVLAIPGDPYSVAQNVIEAFRRTWPETLKEAPRFSDIALHSLLVLIENRLTLVEFPRLLTDKDWRDQLLKKVANPDLAPFFHDRFDRWGRERPMMIESLLNKVTALTLNPALKLILGARESRLNLRQIMDQRKVLIINLGAGDQETRNLLGSLLMVFFEQAAFSRVELPKEHRPPFFLAVDEFQEFCAHAGSARVLAEVLSECRKFGLHLCLAHQSLSQLESDRLQGALEQAQIKVLFGTGRQTARAIVGDLFLPDPSQIKHEVADEQQQARTHPLYTSLAEQFEGFTQAIQRLKRRSTLVQLPETDQVVALRTLTVPRSRLSRSQLEDIKEALVRKDGVTCQELVRRVRERRRQTKQEVEDFEPRAREPDPSRVIYQA